jgi:hypothetical protein
MRGRVGQQPEQDGVDGNVAVLSAAVGGVGGGLSGSLLVMRRCGRGRRSRRTLLILWWLLLLLLLLGDESGEGGMELRDGEVRVVVAGDWGLRRLVQVRTLSLGKLCLLRVGCADRDQRDTNGKQVSRSCSRL